MDGLKRFILARHGVEEERNVLRLGCCYKSSSGMACMNVHSCLG